MLWDTFYLILTADLFSAPEKSPENFKVTQLNRTFVKVTWKALANNTSIWNSNEKHWLGYELRFHEISIPPLTSDAANASVVFCNGSKTTSQVIGPLAESREYMFEIAAKNSFGITEHFTKICFLMKEGGLCWCFFCIHCMLSIQWQFWMVLEVT